MNIALGTGSAYKVRLLKHVLTKLGYDPLITGYNVASGVSDQPQTLGETKTGAINRAQAALQSDTSADIGCGIEFGYEPFDGALHCVAYACIVNREGGLWIEHSSSFKLPKVFSDALAKGKEMGELTLEFDKTKPNTNLFRAVSDFMWKDEVYIQAYHSVFVSYLSDQEDKLPK